MNLGKNSPPAPTEPAPAEAAAEQVLEDALVREQAFLKAVLENVHDGIVACNAAGILTLFNRATRELHGLPEQPIPADEWAQYYDLYLPDGSPMRREDIPLFRALQGEIVRNVEMVIAPKNGNKRTLSASGQALYDTEGNKLGAVVVMHDITEQKQAEAERVARATLEHSRRLLTEIRYVTAHARCLLWHGTVTDYGHGQGGYHWETQVFDEGAAQAFLPLDRLPGEGYTSAWYRCRLPEGQALTDRFSAEALHSDAPDYSAEFGCRGQDGRVRWFDERVYVERLSAPPGALGRWRVIGIAIDITDRKRGEEAMARQARRATLRADVSAALAQNETLPDVLQHCTEAVATHLDAAFARLWTLDRSENLLVLQASAGMYTHLDGPHSRIPMGVKKIGLIAKERKPCLINDVLSDDRIDDREWARREGMQAFTGYPLLVEDRVVGVMALFARHTLPTDTIEALASVADVIAQGIERKRVENALAENEVRQRAFLRDVLGSVTEGRLRLCEDGSHLPPRLAVAGEPVQLDAMTLRRIRQATAATARAQGHGDVRWQDLVTAVGEAAMNAVVHAGGGTGTVCTGEGGLVQVWIEDQGKGFDMANLPRATLERGYTTGEGFGHGFWLMLKTADRVWLLTGSSGTTVVIEQEREEPKPSWL